MASSFTGRYYPPGTGKAQSVRVGLEGGMLKVSSDNGEFEPIPLSDIELRAGGFQKDRIIIRNKVTGETIACHDKRLLAALKQNTDASHLHNEIGKISKGISIYPVLHFSSWIFALVSLGTAAILLYVGIDGLIDAIADRLPKSFDKKVGEIAFTEISKDERLDQQKKDVQRINKLGKKLLANLDPESYEFEFHVLETTDVNAFALPGGKILVCSELMRQVKNDNELAGVLGHEISHVTRRHTLRQTLHKAGVTASVEALMGNDPNLVGQRLAHLLEIADLSYNRKQEEEADLTGVELLVKSGFPADGLLRFLERLEKLDLSSNNRMLAIFSTHPMPKERIDAMRERLEAIKKAKKK
jgi:Zn-dependent protease with chaperone function